MRKLTTLILAAVLPLLCACEADLMEERSSQGTSTITAEAEDGASSRSTVSDEGKFKWSTNDEIAAWNGSSFGVLKLKSGSGTAKAVFQGVDASSMRDVIVYPASIAKSYSSSKLTVTLPDKYEFNTSKEVVATPMAAAYKTGEANVAFKHMCALVRLDVRNVPFGTDKLQIVTPNRMSGDMEASLTGSIYQIDAKASTEKNSVSISYKEMDTDDDKIFNIPFPVGEYSSITLNFLDKENKVITSKSTSKARTLSRADLLILTADASSKLEASITISNTDFEHQAKSGSSVNIEFESTTAWSIELPPLCPLRLDKTSGKAGKNSVKVTATSTNTGNDDGKYMLELTAGVAKQTINVTHLCSFIFERTSYVMDSYEATTAEMRFSCHGGELVLYTDEAFKGMIGQASLRLDSSSPERQDKRKTYIISFPISANEKHSDRTGRFQLALSSDEECRSAVIEVMQPGSPMDTSMDKVVKKLQTHTEGAGIPLVLMGDAFSDTEIDNGDYDNAIQKSYEYMFSVEPFATLKPLFDVYQVYAVSVDNSYSGNWSTAFSVKFGEGTHIEGDNNKAQSYAKTAIGPDGHDISDCLIIITLNDTRYAGTTAMYSSSSIKDIPSGVSIAYVPMTNAAQHGGVGWEATLHHEAGGHGFGKLADEYFYSSKGSLLDNVSSQKTLTTWQGYGCYRNVSMESDVLKTYWSDFYEDPDYAYEHLGAYEGAYTFYYGCYRPTDNSIMRGNLGIFNAPSRLIIYNRAMKIAYKSTWDFSREKFKEWDKPIRDRQRAEARSFSAPSTVIEPLAPPVLILTDE